MSGRPAARALSLALLLVPACTGTVAGPTMDGGRDDGGRTADGASGRDTSTPDDGGRLDAEAVRTDAGDAGGSDAATDAPGVDAPGVDAVAADAGTPLAPRFVAVGYGGHRTVSLDGRTWEHHLVEDPAGGDDPLHLRGVGYGAGVFVAVGNRVMTSLDGIEWSTTVPDTGSFLSDVVWADGLWVAAGGNGLRLRSTDGGATFFDPAPFVSGHFRSIAAGNGAFVAVGHTYGDAGLSSTTRDGLAWSDRSGGAAFSQIAFGAGVFVAVGAAGRVSVSSDGEAWDETTLGSERLGDVAFANGELFVRGDSAYWTSPDGRTWTRHGGSIPDAITYRGGVYVGVTWAGLSATGDPAGGWEIVDSTPPPLSDIAVSAP